MLLILFVLIDICRSYILIPVSLHVFVPGELHFSKPPKQSGEVKDQSEKKVDRDSQMSSGCERKNKVKPLGGILLECVATQTCFEFLNYTNFNFSSRNGYDQVKFKCDRISGRGRAGINKVQPLGSIL